MVLRWLMLLLLMMMMLMMMLLLLLLLLMPLLLFLLWLTRELWVGAKTTRGTRKATGALRLALCWTRFGRALTLLSRLR
jgi:hypothetical protein